MGSRCCNTASSGLLADPHSCEIRAAAMHDRGRLVVSKMSPATILMSTVLVLRGKSLPACFLMRP